MNNKELYHSDIYLGETYNDGIKHWKYVSKQKKNGKWVYYYYEKTAPNAYNVYKKDSGKNEYGTYNHDEIGNTGYYRKTAEIKKGKKLFTTKTRTYGGRFIKKYDDDPGYLVPTTHDVIEIGILQQKMDKAKKKIDKGKKWLSKLFS